jgi:hypothetical protein
VPFLPCFRPPTNITKYNGETNRAVWLEDFQLTCRAGGTDDDYFIIQYLPICVGEHVRAWLEFLPSNNICSLAELKQVFIQNFQGTNVPAGNFWGLKSFKKEPSESLQDYIHRFSRQCNSLPNVVEADVVNAFLTGTTCKSLVHKLSCRKPCTTRELLYIATNHTFGEEVVEVVFTNGRTMGKAKRAE